MKRTNIHLWTALLYLLSAGVLASSANLETGALLPAAPPVSPISEVVLNYSTYTCEMGESFTLSTTPVGLTIGTSSWSSSNSSVASVSSGGQVTAHGAGTAVITVTVTPASVLEGYLYASSVTASCTVTVEPLDGVFYIQNMYHNYYMEVASAKISENSGIRLFESSASSTSYALRMCQMWKIEHFSGSLYILRPMHKLDMGLCLTDSGVVIAHIGTSASSAPQSAYWSIEWNNDGYIIKHNGNSSHSLRSQSDYGGYTDAVVAGPLLSSQLCQRWSLRVVSDPPDGVLIYDTVAENDIRYHERSMERGETKTLSALSITSAVYSGESNIQTVVWSSDDESIATVNPNTGAVTAIENGTARIVATTTQRIDGAYRSSYYILHVTGLADGTYYLKNRQSNRYATNSSGSISANTPIGESLFINSNTQWWTFTLQDSGYYTIRYSASATHYLGVSGDSSIVDTAVVLRADSTSDGSLWKIEMTSNGAYKIISKTGEDYDYVLAMDSLTLFGSSQLIQGDYIDNNSYKDEWYIVPAQNEVRFEAQKKENWCWAACARMLSSLYMDSPISQEAAAVYVKLGVNAMNPSANQMEQANLGATTDEVRKALDYILGGSIAYAQVNKIYSEETLCELLDDGIPIIAARKWINDPNLSGSHDVVIIGYEKDSGGNTWLRIYDPSPQAVGMIYTRTYQSFCYGQNTLDESDRRDNGLWFAVVTFQESCYSDVIDCISP